MAPCTCRDCMELATVPGSLCWECEESGCTPGNDMIERHDCQREDAYGSEDDGS